MTNTALNEKSLEHLLARELRALDDQSAQDRDTEFHLAIEQLLTQFGMSAADAAQILLADQPQEQADRHHKSTIAALKVFRNPYTRETLKTRSFNHQTLKEWRRRHGRLTVQTWRIK
jgi:hypothetical protein